MTLTRRTVRLAVTMLAAKMRTSVRSVPEVGRPLEFICNDVRVGWGSSGLALTLSLLSLLVSMTSSLSRMASSSLAVVAPPPRGPQLLTFKWISASDDSEFREFELNSSRLGDLVEMIGSVPRLRIVDRVISV